MSQQYPYQASGSSSQQPQSQQQGLQGQSQGRGQQPRSGPSNQHGAPSLPNPVGAQFLPPTAYAPAPYYQQPPNTSYMNAGSSRQPMFYQPALPSHAQPLAPHQVDNNERNRPHLSLNLPPAPPFSDPNTAHLPMSYLQQQSASMGLASPTPPFTTSMSMPSATSGSAESNGMTEYFPPFDNLQNNPNPSMPFASPAWSSAPPLAPSGSAKASGSRPNPSNPKDAGTNGAKTSRQQFTACGACRHRRVKCDLKDRQEEAERLALEEDERGPGPHRNAVGPAARRKRVSCTNCQERGTNCVDEYAPLKAAKQLRRGKRISEIEMLYGKSAANAAVASNPDEATSDSSKSSEKGKEREIGYIPDLTKEFFDSAFFRRFQIQRPALDPANFVKRYLSAPQPSAAAMGPEGAILCHVLYAWAVSYGVDEYGRLDVAEGGEVPNGPVDLMNPTDSEIKRENDRQRRKSNMKGVLETILRAIDECGVMRKPSWDGVRVLLLVLPLTEGFSSPVERLAMYEAAISQVFTLCSFIGLGYDGAPSGTSGVNGGTDDPGPSSTHSVRIRIYWYAFVHEGITTGLKGGRLHLDDEDLETIQDSIDNRALVLNSQAFRSSARFATAPINLALACRLINKALTGPSAKRRQHVNPESVKAAWEALETCWEEFDNLRHSSPIGPYSSQDEVIRFADGWKIFLFEAQNVIRKSLEERLAKLMTGSGQPAAFIVDPETDRSQEASNVQHLLDIARSKCEVKTRQILAIVRQHVGTRFFEWDASLVRDGSYYAAMLHAKAGGSDEDVAVCIQALNELRWAHAKAWERSADLRREWAASRPTLMNQMGIQHWDFPPDQISAHPYLPAVPEGLRHIDTTNPSSLSNSPYTSPGIISPMYDSAPGSAVSMRFAPGQSMQDKWFTVYGQQPGPPPLGLTGIPPLSQMQMPPPPGQGLGQGHGGIVQGQGPFGHYVIQPDGSQVYVPYS